MIYRGIFLADGTSDLPLATVLESLCADAGLEILLTEVDPGSLGTNIRTVQGRLERLIAMGVEFDAVFVHRVAEAQSPDLRVAEVARGAELAGVTARVVPVVPVRMTEAWLLLDEAEIRAVAGRPNGRASLNLPTVAEAERLADPKARLRAALLAAGEMTGRRRKDFARDFNRQRRLLLQRLDTSGPVSRLQAWLALCDEIRQLARDLE